MPYSQSGANLLDGMIDRINAEPLAFVVHVGDITSGTGPCGDEWLEARRKQFARFKQAEVLARRHAGLVVLMQANPFVKPRLGGANGFDGILERLRHLGAEMPGKVLLVHGDTHRYRDDEPLPGLRRIEVFGSPQMRWVRGRIAHAGAKLFDVEPAPQ